MHRSKAFLVTVLVFGPVGGLRAQDTAQSIIDRAIRAHGGDAVLARLSAGHIRTRGTVRLNAEATFTQETYFQLPDRMKQVQVIEGAGQKVTVAVGLDGSRGWLVVDGRPRKITDRFLDELKEGMHLVRVLRLVPLREPGYQLSLVGTEEVGGQPAAVIRVSARGHRDLRLYFDRQSGLLVRVGRAAPDPAAGKDVPEERYYDGYRDVDGILSPRRVTVFRNGQKYMTAETVETHFMPRLDPSTFTAP